MLTCASAGVCTDSEQQSCAALLLMGHRCMVHHVAACDFLQRFFLHSPHGDVKNEAFSCLLTKLTLSKALSLLKNTWDLSVDINKEPWAHFYILFITYTMSGRARRIRPFKNSPKSGSHTCTFDVRVRGEKWRNTTRGAAFCGQFFFVRALVRRLLTPN